MNAPLAALLPDRLLDIPTRGRMYDPASIYRCPEFWRGAIKARLADICDQMSLDRLQRLLSAAERKEPLTETEDFRQWMAQK